MHRFFNYLIPSLLIILSGCGTTGTLNLSADKSNSAEIQAVVLKNHIRIKSMKGEGRLSIETPEMSQNASFALILQKPDSVLISIYGPFGIKVGLALVTRNEFIFYSSLENKLVTGSSTVENLGRILHVQLSFDELLSMFAGGTFLSDDLRTPDSTRVEEGQYVFTYSSADLTRLYWINPATSVIQKIQFIDREGKLTLEQTFSDFEDINGVEIPNNIQVSQPDLQQSLYLYYSDISINSDQIQFTFTIPSNAERIRW